MCASEQTLLRGAIHSRSMSMSPTRSADVISAFARNDDGSWVCVHPITIDHAVGRIQLTPGTKLMPGTAFMGVDLVAWLDRQLARHSF